jgi:flavodoxin
MDILIIYDSVFGNTEKIAKAIGGAIQPQDAVATLRVSEVKPEQLKGVRLLVVGSPTRGFQATEGIQKFLKAMPDGALKGMRVAAFDTRSGVDEVKSGILRFLMKSFGFAAPKISDRLTKKGGELAAPPEGFIVTGTEGPLKEGELERAAGWAASLI